MIADLKHETKYCPGCKVSLSLSVFYKNKNRKDGLADYCKSCTNMQVHTWQSLNKEKILKYHLKWELAHQEENRLSKKRYSLSTKAKETRRKYYASGIGFEKYLRYAYNITLEDWNQAFQKQEGKCKICGETKKLYVDHDHKTGKFRGLLCHKHNVGLGYYEEMLKYADIIHNYLGMNYE